MTNKDFKTWGAEAILTTILAPAILGIFFWFWGFVASTYQVKADVANMEKVIQEIRSDVKDNRNDTKEIRTYLMGNK
jgi:hypothetical protein